jgi:type IV pilus assembly protein PilE
MSRDCAGFTLVELLITLTVVAILSAIAWPGYGAIIHRAQRNDGRFALLRLQHLQERHYATHLRYASAIGSAADEDTLAASASSDGGLYRLSLSTTEDGQGYTAVASASPDGRQRKDRDCLQLSIDQTGRRRSANADGTWSEVDLKRCWG